MVQVLAAHEGPVAALAFSPTQPLLASASWDKTVRTWDIFRRAPVALTCDIRFKFKTMRCNDQLTVILGQKRQPPTMTWVFQEWRRDQPITFSQDGYLGGHVKRVEVLRYGGVRHAMAGRPGGADEQSSAALLGKP